VYLLIFEDCLLEFSENFSTSNQDMIAYVLPLYPARLNRLPWKGGSRLVRNVSIYMPDYTSIPVYQSTRRYIQEDVSLNTVVISPHFVNIF